jgi:hypothetical protein
MRAAWKVVVGGIFTGMVGVAGCSVYNIVNALDGGSSGASARVKTGPPTADEVRKTAADFLAAWSAGQISKAAQLTNNEASAVTALRGYRDEAHITKATFKAKSARGAAVPFSVTATVTFEKHTTVWRYDSQVKVTRGVKTGKALVDWEPSVVHPKLARGQTLKTNHAEMVQINAVDRNGAVLDPKNYPSLRPILAKLRDKYVSRVHGEPGIETWIEGADGEPGETLQVITKGEPGKLRTTLDARMQRAAEKAVGKHAQASVVALKASTGEVLAVANANDYDFNPAFMGRTAPGSTFKIITATAILARGHVTPSTPVTCFKSYSYNQGMTFHNVEGSQIGNASFAVDFAQSCNTAFIRLNPEIPEDNALAVTAKKYYGLGGDDWQTGISSFDGSVPVANGDAKSASMIGQDQVQMNPLNMASVAATVRTGSFHQPYLIPQSIDHRPFATAQPLPPRVADQLRHMMQLTVTSGTARGVGLGPGAGAKTGSAEVGEGRPTDGWLTAYRGDIAAAAVVPGGGHGATSAGPIVRAVMPW